MNLHTGSNLISFYLLPEDLSLDNIFSSIEGTATGVIGEGVAASYIDGYGWAGSLSAINPHSGYWVQVEEGASLCFSDPSPVNPLTRYNLHEGSNLVSFPLHGSVSLENALSEELNSVITGIISEGVAASYVEGYGWMGSLTAFEGGKGYWINVTIPIILIYDLDN